MHTNNNNSSKRFAFGVLDNEDSSRDVITNKTGFISRREDNEVELDDDRQALIPRRGDSRSTDDDNQAGRRLSRDELNEVSTSMAVG